MATSGVGRRSEGRLGSPRFSEDELGGILAVDKRVRGEDEVMAPRSVSSSNPTKKLCEPTLQL
jgi:hypothetical protein